MSSLAAGVCCPVALPGPLVLYTEGADGTYAGGMLEVLPRVAVSL